MTLLFHQFLGHGLCDTTNKSAPLLGPDGRATADDSVIGESAWRLLKGLHFDPKELRGIGIHVQKLERIADVVQRAPVSGGQATLPFQNTGGTITDNHATSQRANLPQPTVVIDPPSQDAGLQDLPSSGGDNRYLKPYAAEVSLPNFSQVDPSFLAALPVDLRAELEQEYARADIGHPVAGPSRHVNALSATDQSPPSVSRKSGEKAPADLARITRQLAPRSRPSFSPNKTLHPLFVKRTAPVTLGVRPAELRLLNIDPEVWAGLPIDLQREQLAALRAANVGTGMAIKASMSTQAKQERILKRWRARQRSPSVGIRGQRHQIFAQALELPRLKQRGKSKSEELRVSETEDIQAVIGQWVKGFEDEGPRQGDVEYFGKFLARCVETDVGAERGISALKWWRVLLRQRWADVQGPRKIADKPRDPETREVGREWWNAFWEVKTRMDGVIRKRFGGCLSLK